MQDKEYKHAWQVLKEHKTQQYLQIVRHLMTDKNLDPKEISDLYYKLGILRADLSYMDKTDQTYSFEKRFYDELGVFI